MPSPVSPGLLCVATREVTWIWRDRVALLLVLAIPLIAFLILTATFSNAVVRNLRVDVVDLDRTDTSLRFIQTIDAAPSVAVARRSSDLDGAMHSIRSGAAIAAVYIPQDFERDILAAKRPQIVIFYNKQYFSPGNIASGGLQSSIAAAAATLPKPPGRSTGFAPGSLVTEQYVLTNPALNYVQFLLRAILPTVLHVLTAVAGGYAVGSEFGSRSMREWLAAAGGSPLTALVGKLAPYFGVFILLMVVGLGIIHGLNQIPFRGDAILMGASAILLVIAYLSLGALLQLLVRNLPLGLSLTGVICSPSFGFAGVGFPVLAMGGFARLWGDMLPLRWYIQILFDQAARGVPTHDSVRPFMALAVLAVACFSLSWLRLTVIARSPAKAAKQAAPLAAAPPGIVGAFSAEYKRVLADSAVFGLIVLAPIIYGLLYPQPYLGQLVRKIPVAVVDDDFSNLSRTFIQMLDTDEATQVSARPSTLEAAQTALARREVFGIVGIPAGTEREVLKGASARLPIYVDSTYFLLYNRTLQGITEAAATVTADLAAGSARSDGSLRRAALIRSSPVEILNQPLFNPTGGYASYVVPAAFILILQQTLLMGSATLGGVAFERGGHQARHSRGRPIAVLGQALAHLLLVLPGFALYLIILPHVYGFSTNGRFLDMLVLAIPFILSVSFLGQFVGSWFERRETAVLLFIAISLPLFFQVGVAWPLEAMPNAIRIASQVLPSTAAIDGLVRVNQMGASLTDVWSNWQRLWTLAIVYAALAITSAWWSGFRGGNDDD
ncbi:ABC-type multidrug transport system, permease component [Rhizobium sp. CF122]|uniref:ABC transporter permease n=1 Tax=Rhizobium sp. CF122 TaxID=1144312 RepID=UPI000271B9CD|nr:ABC transporter permease [Rhizobium sp. CF122]EJL57818.1 ABC-type multidrug transport system, permease component [Rhizobium sp. CF122]